MCDIWFMDGVHTWRWILVSHWPNRVFQGNCSLSLSHVSFVSLGQSLFCSLPSEQKFCLLILTGITVSRISTYDHRNHFDTWTCRLIIEKMCHTHTTVCFLFSGSTDICWSKCCTRMEKTSCEYLFRLQFSDCGHVNIGRFINKFLLVHIWT